MQRLESRHNPKIRQLLALRERRERDATGLFLLEGVREVERALQAGVKLHSLYIAPELLAHPFPWKGEQYELPRALFEKVSYREGPDGLLAIAHQRTCQLTDLKGSLFLLAESVEKPGNLGAMLRTCDAVGVDGLLVCDPTVDLFNPNVVRASMGALFSVMTVVCSREEATHWLKERGIALVAATPEAESSYWECNLKKEVVIAVGREHDGLSSELLAAATHRVSIPMRGQADSLNVATAAALLLYEALRQRLI